MTQDDDMLDELDRLAKLFTKNINELPNDPQVRGIMIEAFTKKHKGLQWDVPTNQFIRSGNNTVLFLQQFITQNPSMLKMKQQIEKLSRVRDEVLISGETGTGKELIAHALHGDRKGPFKGINCAGLPTELIESELFGHVAGAFTGAMSKPKEGLMTACADGTLFLDEIGELPLVSQGKLLRALQAKEIRKVGGNALEQISCRIVCATNRSLRRMCENNEFRLDLYARISVFELHTLPLRERMEDVVPITESKQNGSEFLEACKAGNVDVQYIDYSLNVRSIERYIRRYKVLNELPELTGIVVR